MNTVQPTITDDAVFTPGKAKTTPEEAAKPDIPVNARWDELLQSVEPATRDAIWESGITAVTAFSQHQRRDLIKPRGAFTKEQVDELESWLNRAGVYLAVDTPKPEIDTTLSPAERRRRRMANIRTII